jgi:hypothetical protein
MTVDQIAHAFAAGQLTVRTPLWPPGTSGWQALGNFEQFQHSGAFPATGAAGGMPQQPAYGQLSQFEEADDDPTRMWTGSADYPELSGMDGMAMDPPPPAPSVPPQRASARTGPRQVSSRPTARSAPPAPPAPAPVSRTASVSPAAPVFSAQPSAQFAAQSSAQFSAESHSFRPNRRRGSGVWLAAGLVGLVGLGSAVLAVRGGWSSAAPTETAAVASAMPKPEPVSERTPTSEPSSAPEATAQAEQAEQPAAPSTAAADAPQAAPDAPAKAGKPAEANQAQLAKYEDSQASAFVAEGQPTQKKRGSDRKLTSKASKATRESKSDNSEAKEASKPSSAAKPKAMATAAAAPAAKPKATPAAVTEIKEAKTEEKPASSPVAAAVNDAAALALGNAAKLASSCRPQGGPAGPGKARVIYTNDGEVQSVEILTAKFRDTLTGSCVRMVFRRAKIEAFKGEPPTFIKSFTIPEQ